MTIIIAKTANAIIISIRVKPEEAFSFKLLAFRKERDVSFVFIFY